MDSNTDSVENKENNLITNFEQLLNDFNEDNTKVVKSLEAAINKNASSTIKRQPLQPISARPMKVK